MVDLSWINEQIDRLMAGTRCMQSVRDLAALIIVRDNIQRGANHTAPAPSDDAPLSDNMLSTTPTLDQVQRALGAVVINTPEDRQRAQDMQTWLQIIGGKS